MFDYFMGLALKGLIHIIRSFARLHYFLGIYIILQGVCFKKKAQGESYLNGDLVWDNFSSTSGMVV